jgi:Beta-ketoacyl synthase, N-terminal domain
VVVPSINFRIADWMACGRGLETRADLARWPDVLRHLQGDRSKPASDLPSLLRRRISEVGQTVFRVCYALGELQSARFVFCSRYGELDRTLRILRSICESEPVSPTDFSLSVHNALAGLLSIASKNTAVHTAISAGADTFACGLLEAVTLLNDGSNAPVLIAYFDDALPSPYDELVEPQESGLALVVLLEPPTGDARDMAISLQPRNHAAELQSASEQCLDFIRFMLSGERDRRSVGACIEWRWQRCG